MGAGWLLRRGRSLLLDADAADGRNWRWACASARERVLVAFGFDAGVRGRRWWRWVGAGLALLSAIGRWWALLGAGGRDLGADGAGGAVGLAILLALVAF